MGDDAGAPNRHRRRRRATRAQGAPVETAASADGPAPVPSAPAPGVPAASGPAPAAPAPAAPAAKHQRRRRPARDENGTERGLRDIVGAGRSQVGVSRALRARDVNRPTDEELADADRDVAIVRRNWKPTEPH